MEAWPRLVGRFRELSHGNSSDRSILEEMGKLSPKIRDLVVQYLNSGTVFITTPDVCCDVLNPEQRAPAPHVATDGRWVWHMDLPYYVEHYSVNVPEEFVEHMRTNNWVAPHVTEGRILEITRQLAPHIFDQEP